MSYWFQEVARRGAQLGIDVNARSKLAREWFRKMGRKVKNQSANDLMHSDPERLRPTRFIYSNEIGRMVMFFYDATTKEKLPYWDQFPVIFVIGILEDGFLGINLHYLNTYQRAKLMDQLYSTMTSNRTTEDKLRINYKILKDNARFRLFKPDVS